MGQLLIQIHHILQNPRLTPVTSGLPSTSLASGHCPRSVTTGHNWVTNTHRHKTSCFQYPNHPQLGQTIYCMDAVWSTSAWCSVASSADRRARFAASFKLWLSIISWPVLLPKKPQCFQNLWLNFSKGHFSGWSDDQTLPFRCNRLASCDAPIELSPHLEALHGTMLHRQGVQHLDQG